MPRLVPAVLLGLLACTASALAAPLVGRVEGEQYLSPTGQYRIRTPILTDLGGTIEDTETAVTFHDDFGTHISVACFRFDATQRWEFETRGVRDYLLYFFTEVVLANFQSRYPGSAIESARFLTELQDGALIAYATLPGGSLFEPPSVTGVPAAERVVAKRGTLLFVRNRHVYVISTELAERATQRSTYSLTTQQEDDQLSTRLIALVGRLSFTDERSREP